VTNDCFPRESLTKRRVGQEHGISHVHRIVSTPLLWTRHQTGAEIQGIQKPLLNDRERHTWHACYVTMHQFVPNVLRGVLEGIS
jgi:hypothetical protein